MKKTIFKHLAILVAVLVSAFAFSACGDKDDNPDNPNGGNDNNGSVKFDCSLKLDGTTLKFNKAFYAFATEEDPECELIFTDFDINKYPFPNKVKMFIISIYGRYNEIPTGTFHCSGSDEIGNYEVLVYSGNLMDEDEESYEVMMEEGIHCGDLTITKNGSKYEVSIPELSLEGELKGQFVHNISTSFGYKGAFQKANISID